MSLCYCLFKFECNPHEFIDLSEEGVNFVVFLTASFRPTQIFILHTLKTPGSSGSLESDLIRAFSLRFTSLNEIVSTSDYDLVCFAYRVNTAVSIQGLLLPGFLKCNP